MKRKPIVYFSLIMLLAAGAIYLTPFGCGLASGKWGSAEGPSGLCTTHLCYYLGNCGHWANPIERCSSLKVGDRVSKAVFELGEPDTETSGKLSWQAAKGGSETIGAIISDGRLIEIKCNREG